MKEFDIKLDKFTFINIEKIVNYAESHPIDSMTLMKMVNYNQPDYKGPRPAGINSNNTIRLYSANSSDFYTLAISIEEMNNIWIRHFSASVSNGDIPDFNILNTLLPFFGFKSTLDKLWIKKDKGVIHIMEPRDCTWKDILR